ncbi:Pleckstrin y domain-containing F member 2 [Dissophora globulifera]|nr:Pleckstrin y domain-containing F member 2 [Dissophora globulifera]
MAMVDGIKKPADTDIVEDTLSTETITPSSITAVLHKKDSGTSMAASASPLAANADTADSTDEHGNSHDESNDDDNIIDSQHTKEPPTPTAAAAETTSLATAERTEPERKTRSSHSDNFHSASTNLNSTIITPTGRVLTRPLSTSKLSATATSAPHILPNPQRYAGFNLAALGQLSPSASTATMMTTTMSRADTLMFLNSSVTNGSSSSNNSNNVSYFTIGGGGGSPRLNHRSDIYSLATAAAAATTTVVGPGGSVSSELEDSVLPCGTRSTSTILPMCGSEAISLLNLDPEDSQNDLVMIDSNGNSSGSGVTGAAVVGETMVSASAIVTNSHASAGHHPYHHQHQGIGGSLAAGLALTTSASSTFLGGVGIGSSSSGGGVGGAGSGVAAGTVEGIAGKISSSAGSGSASTLSPKSSFPSLTSQARRDAVQRAAMIAAMQQNGGAKILAAHRIGRRQDRPSRNIRFGEFHRICEIEYGFDQGKPLIANGRTLVQTIRVLRIDGPKTREEMLSYLLLFDSATIKDNFQKLLNETIVAHKHHLLFQSKYLADLKKFKRHSAFSFDTSFLKTWGIPGGLTLGSIKVSGSGSTNGHGPIGPGTFMASPVASPGGGALDPYQYQHHFNRPQSMAGSLFSFALNGGSFPSFSDNHSKESSYATLRGVNAANALQYHHQQQQLLQQQLQNRLSMTSVASGSASPPGKSGIDRTSTGSAFDALWFMKTSGYGGGDHGRSTRKTAAEAVAALPHQHQTGSASFAVAGTPGDGREKSGEEDVESLGSATSAIHSFAPTTKLSMQASTGNGSGGNGNASNNNNTSNNNNNGSSANNNSPSGYSSSASSLQPSFSSTAGYSNMTGTLRNGAGWVRDEDAAICMVCNITRFGVLVRKHHCRLCGRVICWKCCQMKDVVLTDAVTSGVETNATVQQEPRKPIRVCLDCIEHNSFLESSEAHAQQQQQPHRQPVAPQSSSFAIQGVLGRLLSSANSGPHLMTSAANATGSTATMAQATQNVSPQHQMPVYPRKVGYGRTGHPYPHHHRASLYRIDVERVGEEDEEDEEDEDEPEHGVSATSTANEGQNTNTVTTASTPCTPESTVQQRQSYHQDSHEEEEEEKEDDHINNIIRSNHGTIRLKDLDPADINEDEVNTQIMTLESEVESMLIQNAPLMFGSGHAASSGHGNDSRVGGSSAAGKTRVLRGIPKEFLKGNATGLQASEEDENWEEKTMEELLAEQEEQQAQHLLAR